MPDNENLLNTQELEDSVSIDNLTQSPDLDGDDVIVMVHENNGVKSTYKAILRSIANFINKLLHYSTDLHTQNDTIIGAINELADGGASADITTEINTPASMQTFADGGDGTPLKSCEVAIPVDTTGFNEVNVFVSNKNFCEITEGSTTGDVNFTMNDNGTVSVSGSISTGNRNANIGHFILPAGTYTMSGIPDSLIDDVSRKAAIVLCKDAYSGSVNIIKTIYSNVNPTDSFTLTEATNCYMRIYVYSAAGTLSNVVFSPQVEKGEEVTSFIKHQGKSYTIALGETLTQGGTLEAVSGLLTRTDTTTSQLTGANIPTLSGVNNIYADSGDVQSLEYFNAGADDIDSLIELENRIGRIDYSLQERVVGKWIDGSTLYEKTLYFNNVKLDKSDNTSELVHGISNIGSVKFVSEVYVDFSGGQNGWSPANNGLWNNGVYNFYWVVGDTSIYILSASGVYFDANQNRSYLVKIRYTKA